ncbi:unnamed protein product [Bursaphelenchus xylophilus]|uniref:(pine wood nematode) hypothetical protein n=1 Tax=Bursaphelenchus xylophilus TaxID=6326 RepID=A0A1I7RNJ4_BURXY|nr:unnamed protein product [Bursaphelenchus xylophilus]CAG9124084.1 unnamed protein product [Bursaphelenchus xylophilus]
MKRKSANTEKTRLAQNEKAAETQQRKRGSTADAESGQRADLWRGGAMTASDQFASNSTTIDGVSVRALMAANRLNLTVCPEGVYSDDQKGYRIYANMPISIFGIFANILNIFIFADPEMRTMLVNHFLLVLSISDLLLLACNFCFLVLPVLVVEMDSFFWNNVFPQVIRYSYPLALTAQTCGVYLTVLVSVHRFLGVCYPFKAKRWVTRSPVQWAIFGSVAFSVLINVPTWLELSVVPCYSERFSAPSQQIALAPFHEMTYVLIKKTIVYTFVMFAFPFAVLITVNIKIIQAMRHSSKLRKMHTYSTKSECQSEKEVLSQHEVLLKQFRLLKHTKYSEMFQTFSRLGNSNILKPSTDIFKNRFTNSWRDRSVTLMLLAIVALFLLCNGLAFCNGIMESIMLLKSDAGVSESVEDVQFFERAVEVSNVLITLNSSTSTLVYIIFSSKYRLIFLAMMGLKKRVRVNRVALTTGLACQRAVELSLIPDEAGSRKTEFCAQLEMIKKRRGTDAISYTSVTTEKETKKKKLFRSCQSTLANSLTNSESNLKLMDCQDSKSRATSISVMNEDDHPPSHEPHSPSTP